MSAFLTFVRNRMLPIGMILGASGYLIYHSIPALAPAGPVLYTLVSKLQPALLFAMLFLTFCRIGPRDLKPRKWHLWLLLIQSGLFVSMALLLSIMPEGSWRVIGESAMLCLICPTATACAVVTGKLGGDMPGVITYTILINLVVSVLVPLMVPIVHPQEDLSFIAASLTILSKVFPLLMAPCLLAWLIRLVWPRLHDSLQNYTGLAFYFWAISLTLAILMTTRAIVHSSYGVGVLLAIAVVSLFCCIFQFRVGKKIGASYKRSDGADGDEGITAGQVMGQKNTVLAIWMGYTFLSPVTSVAGGFYSIWHNLYNTWQLDQKRKADEAEATSARAGGQSCE